MKILKTLLFVMVVGCSLGCGTLSTEEIESAEKLAPNVMTNASSEIITDDVFIEGIGTVSMEELVKQTPMTISDEILPSRYDATRERIVTSVKNQRNFGTCWAFSSISAMETNMIKKGYENVHNVDYSELHHAYFAHARNVNFGDGQSDFSTTYGYYGADNPIYSSSYLVGWQGVTNEKDYPYPPADKEYIISEDHRYESVAHLQDFLRISPDVNSIKKAISEYGSVSAGYFDSDNYSDNYAFYQTATTASNHAITIVGWDDNYPVSNFEGLKSVPTAPGAWRVKNSWGEHWGDNGYFWISYQEPSLKYVSAFNTEPSDNYQIIHQYDGASPGLYAKGDSAANIFTASQNQELKAVGFYNLNGGVTYSVKVYTLNSNAKTPLEGQLVGSTSGALANIGYHTVILNTPVTLAKDDRFSVVVSISDGYFAFEGNGNTAQSGQSFIYMGQRWFDAKNKYVSTERLNNACIKAYATNESFTVSFEENGGSPVPDTVGILDLHLDIPENPTLDGKFFAGWFKDSGLTEKWDFDTDTVTAPLTLYAAWSDSPIPVETISLSSDAPGIYTGDNITVSCKVLPYYATNKEVLWKGSSTGISVSEGVVTGIRKGTYTVTAIAADESGIAGSLNIQVIPPMKNIEVFTTMPVLTLAEEKTFGVFGENVDHYDFYVILPSGSGICYTNVPNVFSLPYKFGEGKHTFYTVAYDAFGNSLKSPEKTFWISDSPLLVARCTNGGYQIGGFNGSENSRVFAAYYKDDTLLSVVSLTANNTLASVENKNDADTIKIMWWNPDTGNSPITDFIEIDKASGNRVGKTYISK